MGNVLSKIRQADPERLARDRLLLLDSTREGIYRIDAEGSCLFMNVAAGRMLGYGLGEAIGTPMHDMHHHSGVEGSCTPARDCPVHGVLEERTTIAPRVEIFCRRDGTKFPVECTAHPLFECGEYQGSVIAFVDITERRKAERRLQVQYEVSRLLSQHLFIEEALPRVLATIAEGLDFEWVAWWGVEQEAGVLRLINYSCRNKGALGRFEALSREIVIRPNEGFLGRVWASGVPAWILEPGQDRNYCRAVAAAAGGLRSGFAVVIRVGDRILGAMEFLSREPRPEEPETMRAMVVTGDAIGQFLEHRRSEERSHRNARLVESIMTSVGDGVVVADKDGKLVLVNPAAATLVPVNGLKSMPGEQHVWKGDFRPYLPDGVTPYPVAALPLTRAVAGESVDSAELFVRTPLRPNGVWVHETARPILDEKGVVQGGVVIIHDVTEQKRSAEALRQAKEEAEAANRAKSEFLSRMSHELRTPLNAILGFGQILELDDLTPEQTDGVNRILKAGRHLLGLINEILDIARIEAGRMHLEIESIRPYDVMEAALELVQPLMAQRKIQLNRPEAQTCPWRVEGDRQRLTQVFLNMLGNAVKYNREDGSVTVSFTPVAGRLRISVADTGPGIAPQNIGKVFNPFERLGAERTRTEGAGLGLALCDRMVRLMNGVIGVESELGKGSVFYVELPLSADQAESGR